MDLPLITAIATRAVRTAAQAAITAIGADTVDFVALDWANIAQLSAGMALMSVLTSLAVGVPEVPTSATVQARVAAMATPLPDDNLDHGPDDTDPDEDRPLIDLLNDED